MAVIDVAENGKYFSPHDANIGGVLCEDCFKAIKFDGYGTSSMTGECCNKVYILSEENNNYLTIVSKESA